MWLADMENFCDVKTELVSNMTEKSGHKSSKCSTMGTGNIATTYTIIIMLVGVHGNSLIAVVQKKNREKNRFSCFGNGPPELDVFQCT